MPFLSRWLDNLRADQLPDGRIPIFSPRSPFDAEAAAIAQGIGSIVAAAGWSDAIAIVPWTLYERYGDRRVLEDNYDAMARWIEYQRRDRGRRAAGLRSPMPICPTNGGARRRCSTTPAMHFGDWLTPSTMEGRPMHEAISIAPDAHERVHRADVPGADADARVARGGGARSADGCRGLRRARGRGARGIRRRVRRCRRRPAGAAAGRLRARARVRHGARRPLRPRTAARLVELVHERGDRLDTGFLSTPYLLDVLCDHGYPEVARTLLWQSEMPSWLYEVDHGATTFWETWDAISPDGEIRPMSFNHYAPGSVDDWLYRRVAGIRSTSPGYRTAVIEPDFDTGVDHVAGARRHAVRPARAWSGRGRGMRHPSSSRCRSRRGGGPRGRRGGCGAASRARSAHSVGR